MSSLQTISYSSSAVHVPTPEEIVLLLAKARARNLQESVTGVLLYADGTFHQYIEGPVARLERVFAAISRDPLHRHLVELVREPIAQRSFAAWSMGYRAPGHIEGLATDAELTALLADGSSDLPKGRLLLNAFWWKGMGRRYQAAIPVPRRD